MSEKKIMNNFIKLLALWFVSLLLASQIVAQSNAETTQKQGIVLKDVPQKVDAKTRYLFYISGYIVHAGDLRPTSPKFGVYEYEQILETFRRSGFVVISEARKQSVEIEPYAKKVAEQARQLLNAGVPPQNITIVGASQGSWIAMLASTYLKNRNLNFVAIGSCAADDGLLQLVDLHGNILFISERTDLPARCQRFRTDATGLSDYKEVETNTGQKHGFLYRPMKEWVEPTIEWAQAHSKVGGSNSLEQELMRLHHAVDEAETKKDFAALDRLLANGYIFTAPTGAISDKKQLIEDIKNAEPEAGQTISYDEVKVHAYGDSAVVNYLMTVKGRDKGGKDYTNRYRNTVTWVKQQNRWRMAAIHVSRIRA
ncbi:MAG: nuclear transport factor 2 family protein [Acidobacteria bacterium]|nr:nuclear transport factor 2 family protein [Acidobacteriota bacterium]